MKASELMIGDYIVSDLGKIYRVKGVRDLDGGEVLVSTGKADMWYEYKLIRPIPLTEELLLLNGFRKRSHYYELYVEDGDYYFEICNFDGSLSLMFANTGIILNYVHQLQHALRLDGSNELADNFKVE